MDQKVDGRISHTINRLITSLYLLTPKSMQQPSRNGEPCGARLSSSELEDLSQSKLWKDNSEWSNEVREIRSELVRGKRLSYSEICLRLKTLKLVDKKIREIDDGLLSCSNLKELTLTGNFINHIDSHHLPKQLEVLECCYNELSDVSDLAMSPPPLLAHLGLSHNNLCSVKFPQDKWSSLVSLDLSSNLLSDLNLIMRTLLSLVHLRNLSLMGNPLALATAYRAYVIDKMRNLSILDDIMITSDEKKSVYGVARKARDTTLISTAELKIQISAFTGLPPMQLIEETADSPQLTRYYLITSYSFMPVFQTQSADITSTDNITKNKETVNNLLGNSTSNIQFPPAPYHTRSECSFSKIHMISDLTHFQSWLREGFTINIDLQKATFIKNDQTNVTTLSRPPSTSRPSSSKKEKPSEKKSGKKRKASQVEEPGEDWNCTERLNTCIGTANVSMTALLDGGDELTDCINMSITGNTVCTQFQSDAKATATGDSITEVQWSMKCNCVLRKVQTIGDFKHSLSD